VTTWTQHTARTCALTLASLALLWQPGCSSSDTDDAPFNQLVGADTLNVDDDAFAPGVDVPPLADGGDDSGPSDVPTMDVPASDIAPADAPPSDAPTADASMDVPADVGPDVVDPGDGATVDAVTDGATTDTSPDVVDPGDGTSPDVPTVDAVDPGDADGTSTDAGPPECEVHADCLAEDLALEVCQALYCIEGTCVQAEAKVGTACDLFPQDVSESCVVGGCDALGDCVAQLVSDIPCDDGNPCTEGEMCSATGVCEGGSQVLCIPPGPCLASICDPAGEGCIAFPSWEDQPCNDEDSCTENTTCIDGACIGGQNLCSCESDADCPADEDMCNGTLACVEFEGGGKGCKIVPDSEVVCAASDNPCVVSSCESSTGECLEKILAGALCTDDDLCTQNDVCNDEGVCIGVPVTCEDEDPCTQESCSKATGTCLFEPTSGLSCSDGDPCTTGDICEAGECLGAPKLCDDGNACTDNKCDSNTGSCVTESLAGGPCDDENACTDEDHCSEDAVCQGINVTCDDANPCTGLQCDPSAGCLYDALAVACDDGDACTGPDLCTDGACNLKPLTCDDEVACTVDSCDVTTGCIHDPDDVTCDDGDPCTEDSCVPTVGCVYELLSVGPCDDENACTVDDACAGGACVGKTLECDDGLLCTLDGCDPLQGCTHATSDEVCEDGNPCTDDACSLDQGCVHEANTDGCEDGNDCTSFDTCQGGQCEPGVNECSCDPASVVDLYWSAESGDGETAFYEIFEETHNTLDDGQELTFSAQSASLTGASLVGQSVSYRLDLPPNLGPSELHYHLGGASIEQSAMYLFWEDADGAFHDIFCSDDGLNIAGWTPVQAAEIPYACSVHETNYNVAANHVFGPDATPVALHLRMFIHAVPTGDTFYVYELGYPDPLVPVAECDDGDMCNGLFTCLEGEDGQGSCEPIAGPTLCPDETDDPCTHNVCDPANGYCVPSPVPDGTPCVDADPCTVGETCLLGTCVVSPVVCDDDVACTVDQCDVTSGGCTHTPVDSLCNDFVPCTLNICDPTQGCVYTPSVSACDDGIACTEDHCDVTDGCSHEAKDLACDDGVPCTLDTCDFGLGCFHTPNSAQCSDGNPCTQDLCKGAQGCAYEFNNSSCDDANPCTQGDTCSEGTCQGGAPKPCPTGNPCKAGTCEPTTGQCEFSPLANGTTCEDGDACTNPDTCSEGLCSAGPVDICDDGLACTIDSCAPDQGCVHEPQEGACDDGNPCSIDVCEPGIGCVHLEAPEFNPCSDGLDGTGPDVCIEGLCLGFQTTPIPLPSDWWCEAIGGMGRALGVYGGKLFAVVNYAVSGFFCEGEEHSQVFALEGATPPTTVPNSQINATLTSIAYDGVFSKSGEVGQFAWGVGSISYFFGDLIDELDTGAEYYGAWDGHLPSGDLVEHRTYVVGQHPDGKKGQIWRCLREGSDAVDCSKIAEGLSKGQKAAFRPIAVDGFMAPDPDCGGGDCELLFGGTAMVSNDTDGLASLVWGDGDDHFDYSFVDGADTVYDVERSGQGDIWVSGNQGYLGRFSDESAWVQIAGPPSMAGLELRALGRAQGHLLVGGHWVGNAGGEAFLFVLPNGSDPEDPGAWVTVSLGLLREVHAIHADAAGLTLLGRTTDAEGESAAFLWFLAL